jgi:hypothetical protein
MSCDSGDAGVSPGEMITVSLMMTCALAEPAATRASKRLTLASAARKESCEAQARCRLAGNPPPPAEERERERESMCVFRFMASRYLLLPLSPIEL